MRRHARCPDLMVTIFRLFRYMQKNITGIEFYMGQFLFFLKFVREHFMRTRYAINILFGVA